VGHRDACHGQSGESSARTNAADGHRAPIRRGAPRASARADVRRQSVVTFDDDSQNRAVEDRHTTGLKGELDRRNHAVFVDCPLCHQSIEPVRVDERRERRGFGESWPSLNGIRDRFMNRIGDVRRPDKLPHERVLGSPAVGGCRSRFGCLAHTALNVDETREVSAYLCGHRPLGYRSVSVVIGAWLRLRAAEQLF